jgi:hypothetical protein
LSQKYKASSEHCFLFFRVLELSREGEPFHLFYEGMVLEIERMCPVGYKSKSKPRFFLHFDMHFGLED